MEDLMSTIVLDKYIKNSTIRKLYGIVGIYRFIIDGIVIYNELIHEPRNYRCLIGICLWSTGYSMTICILLYLGHLDELLGMIRRIDQRVYESDRKQMRNVPYYIKFIIFGILITTTFTTLSFSPMIGDEYMYFCQLNVMNTVFLNDVIIVILLFLHSYQCFVIISCFVCYCFHLGLQFDRICSYLEKMKVDDIDFDYLTNTEYQEVINKKLMFCIERHNEIRSSYNKMTASQQLRIDLESESEDDARCIISHLLGKENERRMKIHEKERVMKSSSYPVESFRLHRKQFSEIHEIIEIYITGRECDAQKPIATEEILAVCLGFILFLFGDLRTAAAFILLSLTVTITISCSICFIKYEISPRSNFRMVSAILLGIMFCIILCYAGQLVQDKSDQFHEQLYHCQWIYWNEVNKKSLLTMLSCTVKSMRISYLGMFILNRDYLLTLLRTIYSMFCVAQNMK